MSSGAFTAPEVSTLTDWLDGYEVIEMVACGGMGAVYRARQLSLDRFVALKVLPPELAADEDFRSSFEAEAKAMAQLAHSNLIGVYDFGAVEDMLYLVMEFVEGNTLHASSFRQAIDVDVAVDLVKQVATGLGEAHYSGIVHRDIKPANILINHDLVPKLGDFGLAVPHADVESGLVMGTPAYMAPEVVEDPLQAGFSSDTFGLGVILYELLTGQSIQEGDEFDLNLVPARKGLRELLQRACSPTIAMRFQDGREMAEALVDWEKNKGRQAVSLGGSRPAPYRSGLGSVPAPNRAVVVQSGGHSGMIVGIVAVVVLVIGTLFFLNGRDDPERGAGGNGKPRGGLVVPTADPTDPDNSLTGGSRTGSGDPETVPDSGPKDPPEDAPEQPAQPLGIDELREAQTSRVLEASETLRERRQENWDECVDAIGSRAGDLLAGASRELGDLPRHFSPGKVVLSKELAEQLTDHIQQIQQEDDRWIAQRLRSLHEEAVEELGKGSAAIPAEVRRSPEAWIEWLDLHPLEVACRTLCGEWVETERGESLRFVVGMDGTANWISGRDGDQSRLELADQGRVILGSAGGDRPAWTLRWRGEKLVGTDDSGKLVRFRREPFSFYSLVGEGGSIAAGDQPDDDISDPDVKAVRAKYLENLKQRIEPLEDGYLRVLAEADRLYANRGDGDSQSRIARERAWVEALHWRDGKLTVDLITEPTDVPASQDPQQNLFLTHFRERYGDAQQEYLLELKALKLRKERAGQPIDEVQRALALGEKPEGVVSARFVKIESRETAGGSYGSISELEILDQDGNPLPSDSFGPFTCSTRANHPRLAFDGNEKTFWNTSWEGGPPPFPHWLAIDLNEPRMVSGFRMVPRHNKEKKCEHFAKWVFYVSNDGEQWKEAAAGTFPRDREPKVHRGLLLK